ncbi:PhzF family phenazine biosynthesis protein [Nemorincola caseinilytica]|uniref:PhzF family phenazine biosynthesis protein n=2 Tax=Nemorincola caseinilytica TaxID=2054315 RepID=A0ABP8N8B3_9BACT
MKIKMYQADAFTDRLFRGNPAAVCMLPEWLPETAMQAIAAENNLAETAFIVTTDVGYEIRWFTPTVEVDLCGHATLAAAHIIFQHYNATASELAFHSHRSGTLRVTRENDLLTLDFPVDTYEKVATPAALVEGLGIEPMETFKGKTDYMAVLPSEQDVIRLRPDLAALATLDARGIIVTAAGTDVDFVSRFFGPRSGINEDPVTGSAHTTLTPYWSAELGRDKLSAIQLSERKGYLWCKMQGERVAISGNAVTFLQGEIEFS